MEREQIPQWLRVTGKRLVPMKEFLENVAEIIDNHQAVEKSASEEITKKLQTIAEYVWLERDEATLKGINIPEAEEVRAIISAMNELNPSLNIVGFTKELTPVA